MDNSPVPGVSVSGSCVAGGRAGRWSASECALTLGPMAILLSWSLCRCIRTVLDLDGKVVLASLW